MKRKQRRGRVPAAPKPESHYSLTSQAIAAHGSCGRYLQFNLTRLGHRSWNGHRRQQTKARLSGRAERDLLRIAPVGMDEEESPAIGPELPVKSERSSSWFTARQASEPVHGHKTLVERLTGGILGARLLGPHANEVINSSVWRSATASWQISRARSHAAYGSPSQPPLCFIRSPVGTSDWLCCSVVHHASPRGN